MVENDEYTEGLEEDELEDSELEELKKNEGKEKKPAETKEPKKQKQKKPTKETDAKPKKRYGVFSQHPRLGIVDLETNEVVAEGEVAILESLSNVIERLERIESNIGSLIGGE